MAPVLSEWESFYVIVGSSAAALTGLQFVVITLVSGLRRRAGTREIDAFATPTVVHFGAVLLVSAVLSAPWGTLRSPALLLGALGAAGLIYTAVVTRRASATKNYKPVLEDWIWHVVLPFVGYATLLGAAATFVSHERDALFAVGATALLLLFIGIHNAWDTVTYIALEQIESPAAGEPASPEPAASRDKPTPVELL
ncbi:MAG TPA: hypothetical protein VHM30_19650 [Gemmatimonadaceae bacterium]|nr:hypothetical protein [Gemmatimonadaceae bacterium]